MIGFSSNICCYCMGMLYVWFIKRNLHYYSLVLITKFFNYYIIWRVRAFNRILFYIYMMNLLLHYFYDVFLQYTYINIFMSPVFFFIIVISSFFSKFHAILVYYHITIFFFLFLSFFIDYYISVNYATFFVANFMRFYAIYAIFFFWGFFINFFVYPFYLLFLTCMNFTIFYF